MTLSLLHLLYGFIYCTIWCRYKKSSKFIVNHTDATVLVIFHLRINVKTSSSVMQSNVENIMGWVYLYILRLGNAFK